MKKLVLGAIASILLLGCAPAEAAYRHHYKRHVTTHRFAHYLTHRHYRVHHRYAGRHYARANHDSGAKPSCFYTAASMGGPCGCWAGATILGVTAHVWHGINLWLANDWLRFPHVSPDQATAAVWPHRHVAPVVPGTYRNGTIMVRDSWATHRVRTAGLVFVQTPGARSFRRELIKYSATPL